MFGVIHTNEQQVTRWMIDIPGLGGRCLRVVSQRWFDVTVLLLICVSGALLAPQCDVNWPEAGSSMEYIMYVVDIFFTVAFTLEMALKAGSTPQAAAG